MTREIIALGLEAEGLKASNQGYTVPEEREGTCFLSTGGEPMLIGRVVKIDLRDKYLFVQTSKDERYFFAYENVVGFRFAVPAKERAAGFAR